MNDFHIKRDEWARWFDGEDADRALEAAFSFDEDPMVFLDALRFGVLNVDRDDCFGGHSGMRFLLLDYAFRYRLYRKYGDSMPAGYGFLYRDNSGLLCVKNKRIESAGGAVLFSTLCLLGSVGSLWIFCAVAVFLVISAAWWLVESKADNRRRLIDAWVVSYHLEEVRDIAFSRLMTGYLCYLCREGGKAGKYAGEVLATVSLPDAPQ
ncbi:MAG: hypothetical protein IKZ07_05485 [Akkermansia sp.]|nr:hypothetical protein [Akkermansia sp.]